MCQPCRRKASASEKFVKKLLSTESRVTIMGHGAWGTYSTIISAKLTLLRLSIRPCSRCRSGCSIFETPCPCPPTAAPSVLIMVH
jgi:hypothetical protein